MTPRVAGLALGDGRGVFAGWPAGGTTAPRLEPFVFNASALAAGDETTLVQALERVRRHVPDAQALHVALAAPWTAPRVLGLPAMTPREARVVLARDSARYFPRVGAEPVVTARVLARGSWLACDADGVVLDAIARAGRAAAFADVRIVAAVGAWAQAVDGSAPRAFAVDGEAAVVSAHRGFVTALRRTRTAELAAAVAEAPDALALAARYAPTCAEPEFESRRVATARERATTQAARRLVALGVGLLTAAAGLYGWGATHRADAIETQRAALRPGLMAPLAAHDSLWQLTEAVAAVRNAEGMAPSWLRRLDALATALPEDAYFTVMRGSGDSVVVEGRADDAAAAVTALRTVRGAAVRALSPPATDDDLPAFAAVVHFARTARP